ncbi:intraflagellar transport protein 80 homolog [Xenia sp. Carnegie-2017]|uniref:intraflagellar transport protein 80 homolog n=1 Tax=Xenia sp. Carnegie-2017 TaxID=2897299 RepID=UPI001F03807C|nr:intraflagellar transport protein 80 homolog [Xenia sp. Carnegie-2017]
MRINVQLGKESKHKDLVSCVIWTSADELYSCGDDHKIYKWNLLSDETTEVISLPDDLYPTDVDLFPKTTGAKKQLQNDIFVLTASDGKYYFVSRNGRIEKAVEGHRGAILSIRWNQDGTAFATAGEDGQVKIWSKSGMLRSTLSQIGSPVYSLCWAPDSDYVVYTNNKQLVIKPLQAAAKPLQWKAHDGIVLVVDWNRMNNMILSGGEDCKYKVWDSFGRILYSSFLHEYPITSLSWTPNGELFAIGSFNTLRLCDKTGWSHALAKQNTGSLFKISWSTDGTQLSAACANSQVLFAHIVGRRLEWKNLELTISQRKTILVKDVSIDAKESLDFRDRVMKTSLAFDHLVVTTFTQCYVYSVKNWNTPTIFDLKNGGTNLIMQSKKSFLLVEETGIQIYSYEGRLICTPKLQQLRLDLLNEHSLSLSDDTLVVRDQKDKRALHLFDCVSGKLMGDGKPIEHSHEIVQIEVNQCGSISSRQLAIIDKNRDLFIITVQSFGSALRKAKLGTMVSSISWNDSSNMLAAFEDGIFTVWCYPEVILVDKDNLINTIITKDSSDFGKNPNIVSFLGNVCSIRRADGSLSSTIISPYPMILHKYTREFKWSDAVRLCRFVKDKILWACLATMAAYGKELETAEIAYAAIDEADKVQYINHVKEIPSKEGRNAAMALFCGQIQEAELILLQAGLIFRSIKMHIDLFNWDRALELAVKHKTHVDTVIAFRNKHLKLCEKNEEKKRFLQISEGVQIDWEKINSKIALERENESARQGIQPYMPYK